MYELWLLANERPCKAAIVNSPVARINTVTNTSISDVPLCLYILKYSIDIKLDASNTSKINHTSQTNGNLTRRHFLATSNTHSYPNWVIVDTTQRSYGCKTNKCFIVYF